MYSLLTKLWKNMLKTDLLLALVAVGTKLVDAAPF